MVHVRGNHERARYHPLVSELQRVGDRGAESGNVLHSPDGLEGAVGDVQPLEVGRHFCAGRSRNGGEVYPQCGKRVHQGTPHQSRIHRYVAARPAEALGCERRSHAQAVAVATEAEPRLRHALHPDSVGKGQAPERRRGSGRNAQRVRKQIQEQVVRGRRAERPVVRESHGLGLRRPVQQRRPRRHDWIRKPVAEVHPGRRHQLETAGQRRLSVEIGTQFVDVVVVLIPPRDGAVGARDRSLRVQPVREVHAGAQRAAILHLPHHHVRFLNDLVAVAQQVGVAGVVEVEEGLGKQTAVSHARLGVEVVRVLELCGAHGREVHATDQVVRPHGRDPGGPLGRPPLELEVTRHTCVLGLARADAQCVRIGAVCDGFQPLGRLYRIHVVPVGAVQVLGRDLDPELLSQPGCVTHLAVEQGTAAAGEAHDRTGRVHRGRSDEVQHAVRGVGAIERRGRSAHQLDPGHILVRDRDGVVDVDSERRNSRVPEVGEDEECAGGHVVEAPHHDLLLCEARLGVVHCGLPGHVIHGREFGAAHDLLFLDRRYRRCGVERRLLGAGCGYHHRVEGEGERRHPDVEPKRRPRRQLHVRHPPHPVVDAREHGYVAAGLHGVDAEPPVLIGDCLRHDRGSPEQLDAHSVHAGAGDRVGDRAGEGSLLGGRRCSGREHEQEGKQCPSHRLLMW